MLNDAQDITESSLDPQDWDAMRQLGHRMLDDMFDYLQSVREHPAWQTIPGETKGQFHEPLPHESGDPEAIYETFVKHILPYPLGNTHPRFWGWVTGTGTPMGMLAQMLAAGLNANVGGAEQIATYVETQVIDWCKTMFDFPEQGSGILVSGASIANLLGLTVARNRALEFDVRQFGIQQTPKYLTLYGSAQMHSSLERAVEILGLGSAALRIIPVDSDFQIDLTSLQQQIAADRAEGCQPFCVIGNAGTTNTGAVDNLNALADIAERESLWFHVDGAFGAMAALTPDMHSLVDGIDRADSLAFDLHKWMHIPHEAGCALFRSHEAHFRAFTLHADYLAHAQRGTASGETWFGDYGIQLSRSFRALKIWMSIKEHGIDKYGQLVQQNIQQARYLAQLIEVTPQLELLAPVSLNIVCFRYVSPALDEADLNALNQELLMRLQESGVAVPSHTVLHGKYALRAAIANHRSRTEDFDILVDAVVKLGNQLLMDTF